MPKARYGQCIQGTPRPAPVLLVSLESRPNRNGDPRPNARNLFALPKEQEWGLRQTSCWHRCRQLQGAFLVSPGAPHHPTHLSVSSQL